VRELRHAADGVDHKHRLIAIAHGVDNGERETNLGVERAKNQTFPAGLLDGGAERLVFPSVHRATVDDFYTRKLVLDRRAGWPINAHLHADGAEDDRNVEGLGGPDQETDIELDFLWPGFGPHVLEH